MEPITEADEQALRAELDQAAARGEAAFIDHTEVRGLLARIDQLRAELREAHPRAAE